MFYQSSLLVMLLAPVMTYVCGAMVFSAFQFIRTKSWITCQQQSLSFRNGHSL